ncbi:MAG: sigma-70 family RNA polymerase sigma factor [Candidatus Limnocylindrales bacterium]
MNQRGLVERASRGDATAFDALVTATIARLDGAARLILRDPEGARDAVQEALTKAWRDLPGLRDPDRFDAWLHRLLVRACYDALRRARSRPMQVRIGEFDGPQIGDVETRQADRDELERALRRLDPDLRTTVALVYYVGLSLPDVALAQSVPLGTVKSRLHRARGVLRTAIQADRMSFDERVGEVGA